MAIQTTFVGRATDTTILTFFESLQSKFQFDQFSVWMASVDAALNPAGPEVQEIKKAGKYSLRQVQVSKNGHGVVLYVRNRHPERPLAPDAIDFTNNQNTFPPNVALQISELITDTFLGNNANNLEFIGNPEAFSAVISSHQEIISRLELSLERISEKFTEERLKIQVEQDAFIRNKQDEYSTRESQLREELSKERQALAAREKDLDDRTNMHARRSIRADIKEQLRGYAKQFTLSDKTRKMRDPIHLAVLIILVVVLGVLTELLWRSPDPTDFLVLVKSTVLTAIGVGVLAWYIRWLNRWFERHADAELNLKQFELDVDRASWVVETAMEWRASQHGIIPTHLLDSISKNLFLSVEQKRDENIHPADYLASAIFGSAAKAKLSVGGNEIELDRKGIKNLKKEAE